MEKKKKTKKKGRKTKRLISQEALLDPTKLLDQAIASGLDSGYNTIDDSDIPQAPNAVEWVIGAKYLNVKPFAKQLQDIIHFFSSACYFCSNTEYLADIPVDASIADILDNTQLMIKGRCPRCKRKEVEMRKEWCLDPANTFEGYIKPDPPNELCAIKGQRCVVGETLVLEKTQGYTPIRDVVEGNVLWTPKGWKTVTALHRFKNKPTLNVTLQDGTALRGGYQHKVLVVTKEGLLKFRRYEKLRVGDWVGCNSGPPLVESETECPLPKVLRKRMALKERKIVAKRRYFFQQITRIEKAPKADLYDITIDGSIYWTQRIVSHNSGKSVQTAMMSTYITHRYLKLPNPARWFRLLKRQVLYTTFVSVTATQAWENLWQPYADLIEDSPWFKQYHEFLDQEAERLGVETLWAKKDTYLWYGHKRLGQSFSPADVRTLRGRTRILSAVDEMAWMSSGKNAKVRADGDGTWRALDRSLTTIRQASARKRKSYQWCPDGYMICISSPSSALDPLMRRYYKAPKSPRVYSVLASTWESNPTITEEELRSQTGDMSEAEFICDYGCVPPYSDEPWWDSPDQLRGLCRKDPNEHRLFTYKIDSLPDPLGGKHTWIWANVNVNSADRQTPRCLAIDTGEKRNSFSWALGRFDKRQNTIVCEDVGEVAPGDGQRVHFQNMWEHCILPMVKSFRCLHVVWDHWESSTYVSELRTVWKVNAQQYTVTRAEAKRFKGDMLSGLVSYPMPECRIEDLPVADSSLCSRYPRAHLLLQIMTVRESAGLPQKPQGGQDDTFRAVLLTHVFLRDNEKEYGVLSNLGRRGMVGIGSNRGGMAQRIVTGAGGSGIAIGGRR